MRSLHSARPPDASTLTTTSATAGGAARSWKSVEAFVEEIAQARIYDGVHYRYSTEVGNAVGKQAGRAVAKRHLLHGGSRAKR